MGTQAFTTNVIGLPVSQGSLVARGFGGGLRYQNETSLKMWRQMIMTEARASAPSDWNPMTPVSLVLTFRFPRNKGHYNKRGEVLPSAPPYKATKPDLDKLVRAVGDSLEQSGLILGDSQIVSINAAKRWAQPDESPGLLMTVIATQGQDREP